MRANGRQRNLHVLRAHREVDGLTLRCKVDTLRRCARQLHLQAQA